MNYVEIDVPRCDKDGKGEQTSSWDTNQTIVLTDTIDTKISHPMS